MRGGIWIANAAGRSPKSVLTADAPAASAVPAGTVLRFSDMYYAPGIRRVSSGTIWIPDGVQTIQRGGAAVVAPLDLNENILVAIPIVATLLAPNSAIRLKLQISCTNNANAKTWRVRFDGIGGSQYLTANTTGTTAAVFDVLIQNRGVQNSQIGIGQWNGALNASATSAVDTAAIQTSVVVTAQKGVDLNDAMVVQNYMCEVLP